MARKRRIKPDDLFKLRAVGRVAISPDGRLLAFELKRFDLRENKNFVQIMLADVETGDVRALTEGKHCDSRPRWSPDGRLLAFLSDRDKGTSLWILPMAGGEPRRITDRDGHVREFAFSPDGHRLAYTYLPMSEREKLERDEKTDELKKRPQYKQITRLFHKLDGAGWWKGNYAHVYLVGLKGGKPRQLTHGPYDDSDPQFSPDGRLISFVSNRVEDPDTNFENADIYVVKPAGGRIKKITHMQGGCYGHAWSPDGKSIAYIGDPAKPGQWYKHNRHVWLVPSTGGKPRDLTREIDNQCLNVTIGDVMGGIFEPYGPIWSADSSRLFFLVSEDGATRLYSRSVRRRDLRCELGGDVNIMYFQRTAGDGPIALTIGTHTNPGDVFVADPHDGCRLNQLTRVNATVLDRVEVVSPQRISLRSGSVRVHGWVLRPPGLKATGRRSRRPSQKRPAILEIHGGPHVQYGCSFFHEMQCLAARGYVVVYANPRGSSGYGLKFMNCIHADWGNLDYKDLMRVADWICARPYVDKRRIGVTGGSYGGYMTNWIVGHTDRFRAAVTQRSVVNLESMYGTCDYGYTLGDEIGGTPWKNVEKLRRQSPLTFVKNIRSPLLILHSEQDLRCSIEQAEQLFVCLKLLGREVEFVRFEGESHGLSRDGRPQNRAERLRRIIAWFDKRLSP